MDWSLFHLLNGALQGRDAPQDVVELFATLSVPLFAATTVSLWLVPRYRLAAASALLAAALGLLVNQAIGHAWFRDRPFAAHPGDTVLLAPRSSDPSFPSDHATAAFAIAFAVLLLAPRLGAWFLAVAVAIGLSRVLLGLHYPSDVGAGILIGLASAVVVVRLGRPWLEPPVRVAGRLTDRLLLRVARR